jgi:GH43 family beta-xylosidase
MIYHARDYKDIKGEPLYDQNRHTLAIVIRWKKDGMPDFAQDLDDHETALIKCRLKKKK